MRSRIYVTVGCPSVRLSFLSIYSSSSVWLVCCYRLKAAGTMYQLAVDINQSIFVCIRQPKPIVAKPNIHMHTHAHTHTGLPGLAGTRKVKPVWILLKLETVSGSGISWAVCKSAPRCRQITMPAPHHSVFLQAGCPSCHPTNSVKWSVQAPAVSSKCG